jgi:hypothetical protein
MTTSMNSMITGHANYISVSMHSVPEAMKRLNDSHFKKISLSKNGTGMSILHSKLPKSTFKSYKS